MGILMTCKKDIIKNMESYSYSIFVFTSEVYTKFHIFMFSCTNSKITLFNSPFLHVKAWIYLDPRQALTCRYLCLDTLCRSKSVTIHIHYTQFLIFQFCLGDVVLFEYPWVLIIPSRFNRSS